MHIIGVLDRPLRWRPLAGSALARGAPICLAFRYRIHGVRRSRLGSPWESLPAKRRVDALSCTHPWRSQYPVEVRITPIEAKKLHTRQLRRRRSARVRPARSTVTGHPGHAADAKTVPAVHHSPISPISRRWRVGDLVELCPLTAGLNGAQPYTADGAVPAAPLCQPAPVWVCRAHDISTIDGKPSCRRRRELPLKPAGPAPAVLFDVDGSLVDSNYLHVYAWQRAFDDEGISVAAWQIHRCIGMDGSRLVRTLIRHRLSPVRRARSAQRRPQPVLPGHHSVAHPVARRPRFTAPRCRSRAAGRAGQLGPRRRTGDTAQGTRLRRRHRRNHLITRRRYRQARTWHRAGRAGPSRRRRRPCCVCRRRRLGRTRRGGRGIAVHRTAERRYRRRRAADSGRVTGAISSIVAATEHPTVARYTFRMGGPRMSKRC